MTFDAWEVGVGPTEDRLMHWGIQAIGPSEDVLMHEGVKGMKHGRRRYQLEDGTWTEEGLRERRKREGFGDSRAERKAAKKAERDQRRSEKNEARQERSAARKVAVQEATQKLKNKVKKNDIKDLSDEELQKRIARVKMEQEYRELTKSPILKTGEKIVSKIMDYKSGKEERELESNRQKIDIMRLRTQRIQSANNSKQAEYEAKKAEFEYKKKEKDVEGGLKIERKAQLKNAKTNYRNSTIWGSIGKRFNNRAKYIQENRMNSIEAKKANRTNKQIELATEREKQKTKAEYWKAEQERHKSNRKS